MEVFVNGLEFCRNIPRFFRTHRAIILNRDFFIQVRDAVFQENLKKLRVISCKTISFVCKNKFQVLLFEHLGEGKGQILLTTVVNVRKCQIKQTPSFIDFQI